jgi:hypothetical protein
MAELSRHVPIIPVIMKADTMTIHEAQRFRQEVVNRLQNPSELSAGVSCGAALPLPGRVQGRPALAAFSGRPPSSSVNCVCLCVINNSAVWHPRQD